MNKNGIGFLTFAQNNSNTDYLKLAYAQACNFKSIHPGMKYAVIVDKQTSNQITTSCREVFDYILELEHDYNNTGNEWKFANECQAFALTPFKETIKIESDLLLTRPIDHWLTAFRLKDLVLSFGCKNYRQQKSDKRTYRKFFDDNELPDVYNGLMYFRYSLFAQRFFNTAKQILDNWDHLKIHVFKNCREETPSTDVLYSITAKILGVENCTLPSMDFINFVHMKPSIQDWSEVGDWQQMTIVEHDGHMIRIHNLNQYDPIHYYSKSFITDERLQHYEQQYRRFCSDRIN
jgi:hypothetical protein